MAEVLLGENVGMAMTISKASILKLGSKSRWKTFTKPALLYYVRVS
jgi:hypothetical protein